MNKEWTKIISGTISGILSGLIVVFAQKSLEWRIKKIEKKNKEVNEYLKSKKAVKLFREMHINNSKPKEYGTTSRTNTEWRTLSFDWKYSKECDNYLKKIKEILDKVFIDDDYLSFVSIYSHEWGIGKKLGPAKFEDINWKRYKEILRKSTSYFNYFENLKEESKKLGGNFNNIRFSIDKLDYLCSKINAEVL